MQPTVEETTTVVSTTQQPTRTSSSTRRTRTPTTTLPTTSWTSTISFNSTTSLQETTLTTGGQHVSTTLPPTTTWIVTTPQPTQLGTVRPSLLFYRDPAAYNESKAIWSSLTGIFLMLVVLFAALGVYWYVTRQHTAIPIGRELELSEVQPSEDFCSRSIHQHVNPFAQRNFQHRQLMQRSQQLRQEESIRSTTSDNSSYFRNARRNTKEPILSSVSRPFSLAEEIKKARLKTRLNKF